MSGYSRERVEEIALIKLGLSNLVMKLKDAASEIYRRMNDDDGDDDDEMI